MAISGRAESGPAGRLAVREMMFLITLIVEEFIYVNSACEMLAAGAGTA